MDAPKIVGWLASSLDLVPNGSELSSSELLSDLRMRDKSIEKVFLPLQRNES